MKLTDATEGKEYIVNSINTKDEELNAFLFSLGCYSGEPITVISRNMAEWWCPLRMADIT